jgi:DNA-binding NarL/FixJ family response regulator
MHVELNPRDREVLGFLARGLASKQIASRLHVSERTAKNYVAAAMWRLNAQNRAHAVAIAFRLGLIAPTLDELLSA